MCPSVTPTQLDLECGRLVVHFQANELLTVMRESLVRLKPCLSVRIRTQFSTVAVLWREARKETDGDGSTDSGREHSTGKEKR